MIAFPSHVDLKSGKNIKIKKALEFNRHFDEIITPKILQAIQRQSNEKLFVNSQGTLIGSGEVGFSAVKGPGGMFDQFRITKVDHR